MSSEKLTPAEGEIYPNSGVTAKGVIRLARELRLPGRSAPILDGRGIGAGFTSVK